MSLKKEFHSKCSVIKNGMSLKMKFTQNEIPLKMEGC